MTCKKETADCPPGGWMLCSKQDDQEDQELSPVGGRDVSAILNNVNGPNH